MTLISNKQLDIGAFACDNMQTNSYSFGIQCHNGTFHIISHTADLDAYVSKGYIPDFIKVDRIVFNIAQEIKRTNLY